MNCPYRLGWGNVDLACEKLEHLPADQEHQGKLYDTDITWKHSDRRTYQGERESCPSVGCILPGGHLGNHAT